MNVRTVAIVTGAAGSMGSECARAIASLVDVVVITDRNGAALALQHEALAHDALVEVVSLCGDLSHRTFIRELVEGAAAVGEIKVLVHTAGLSPAMADWRDILHVDLVVVAELLNEVVEHVGVGAVAVCLASISGHMGDFDAAVDAVLDSPLAPDLESRYESVVGAAPESGNTYRLAKRGVIRLCERSAAAWGSRGARIMSVSPGLIDTAMGRLELEHQPIKTWLAKTTPLSAIRLDAETPLPGRIGDIAKTVAFLCSDDAGFITGCDILVDGGLLGAIRNQN